MKTIRANRANASRVAFRASGGRDGKQYPTARCEGDHLECNPCGKVACCEHRHQLAWPGGVAVALAESTCDYSFGLRFFQLKSTRLQFPIALQCPRIGLGRFDRFGFLLLQAVNQHAVEQIA